MNSAASLVLAVAHPPLLSVSLRPTLPELTGHPVVAALWVASLVSLVWVAVVMWKDRGTWWHPSTWGRFQWAVAVACLVTVSVSGVWLPLPALLLAGHKLAVRRPGHRP